MPKHRKLSKYSKGIKHHKNTKYNKSRKHNSINSINQYLLGREILGSETIGINIRHTKNSHSNKRLPKHIEHRIIIKNNNTKK